jgi:hypothetical protein
MAGQGRQSPAEGCPCTRSSPGSREAARRGGGGLGRGPGPQAPGPAGGSDRLADEDGQADPQGLQDLYWMASWREGDKTRNVHLGSSRKMDAEAARRMAREMKAVALGLG